MYFRVKMYRVYCVCYCCDKITHHFMHTLRIPYSWSKCRFLGDVSVRYDRNLYVSHSMETVTKHLFYITRILLRCIHIHMFELPKSMRFFTSYCLEGLTNIHVRLPTIFFVEKNNCSPLFIHFGPVLREPGFEPCVKVPFNWTYDCGFQRFVGCYIP